LYNEDSCYIASNKEEAEQFIEGSFFVSDDYRIDKIYLSDIVNDYGHSLGDYAIEPKAFNIFEREAEVFDIKFEILEDEDLFVIRIKK